MEQVAPARGHERENGRGNERAGGQAHGDAQGTARVTELDALRGLAALAVVTFHYTTFYQSVFGHRQPLGFDFAAGNYGVHLFFLISGYVIFMTLERTRSAMDFVVSRFSRLYPAYWVALAITATVVYTMGAPEQRLPAVHVLANLTMVQEILGYEPLDGSYWTLEVELFFYAQMLFWYMVGQLGRIHWIILGWLALACGHAYLVRHDMHSSHTLRELLLLLYIPFFAIGILFYRIHMRRDPPWKNIALIALGVAAVAYTGEPVHLLVALVCIGIFTLFVTGNLRWLRGRVFVFLGGISYSLYLLHQAIGFAVIHRLERLGVHSWIAVLAALVLSLVLATLLTRWVERPAMAAIRAWWRGRNPGMGRTAA